MPSLPSRHLPVRFPAVLSDLVFGAIEAATCNSFYIQIVIEFNGQLDMELLKQAMGRSLQIEPRFACRFRSGFFGAHWSTVEDYYTNPPLYVIHSDKEANTLHQVLAAELDPVTDGCLCVYLIRATSDTICIKLDHKMGDGQAAKQYAYLLAQAYDDLTRGVAINVKPIPQDRSLAQLLRHRTREERRTLKEQLVTKSVRPIETHCWRFPRTTSSDAVTASSGFVIRKLSTEAYAAVFRYACTQRATVNQVFVAALMRAAIKMIPHAHGLTPSLTQSVDLRRYVPSSELHPPCNLSGLMVLLTDDEAIGSLDSAVAYVRDQMMTARNQAMGIPPILFRIQANVLLRSMIRVVPFWLMKAIMRRRIRKDEVKAAGGLDRLTFTDMGTLDSMKLSKFGTIPKDAYIMSGAGRFPRLHLCCVTTYSGTAQFSIGFSPSLIDRDGLDGMLDAMMKDLSFEATPA